MVLTNTRRAFWTVAVSAFFVLLLPFQQGGAQAASAWDYFVSVPPSVADDVLVGRTQDGRNIWAGQRGVWTGKGPRTPITATPKWRTNLGGNLGIIGILIEGTILEAQLCSTDNFLTHVHAGCYAWDVWDRATDELRGDPEPDPTGEGGFYGNATGFVHPTEQEMQQGWNDTFGLNYSNPNPSVNGLLSVWCATEVSNYTGSADYEIWTKSDGTVGPVQTPCSPGLFVSRVHFTWDNGSGGWPSAGWKGGAAAGEAVTRWVEARADCIDDTGAVATTVSAQSDTYVLGDALPLVPEITCPDGTVLDNYAATRKGEGGLPDLVIADHQYPDEMLPGGQYADCFAGACELMVWRTLDGGTTWQECSDENVNCLGWMNADDMTQFECRWGPYVMPLTDCEPLEEIDENGGAPKVVPPPPAQAPGTEGDPTHVEDGCGSGASWLHPFRSIAAGVACAAEWAFVPSAETKAELEAKAAQAATVVPFSYATDLGTWVGGFATVGHECWTEDLKVPGYEDLRVIDTCSTSGVWGWFTNNRGLVSVLFYLSFGVPLAWWAWKAYAPGTVQGA